MHFPFAPDEPLRFVQVEMDAAKIIGKTLIASPDRQHEADSDIGVVRQVQAGDVAAFDQLVLKYRARVYGVV